VPAKAHPANAAFCNLFVINSLHAGGESWLELTFQIDQAIKIRGPGFTDQAAGHRVPILAARCAIAASPLAFLARQATIDEPPVCSLP
jgi:hypothetical protein